MTRGDAINMLLELADELESIVVDITSGPSFVTMANTIEDILSEAEWLDMMELDMSDLLRAVAGFIRAGVAGKVVFDIVDTVVTFNEEVSR